MSEKQTTQTRQTVLSCVCQDAGIERLSEPHSDTLKMLKVNRWWQVAIGVFGSVASCLCFLPKFPNCTQVIWYLAKQVAFQFADKGIPRLDRQRVGFVVAVSQH